VTPRSRTLTLSWLSEMHSSDNSDDMLEQLILDGMVEVSALDSETGEMLYAFTDKAREQMPEMQRQAEKVFDELIMFFWENGFLSMNVDAPNPVIRVLPKALDEEEVSKLSVDQRVALRIILEALRIQ
jgi:hypothetical protein